MSLILCVNTMQLCPLNKLNELVARRVADGNYLMTLFRLHEHSSPLQGLEVSVKLEETPFAAQLFR